MPPDPPSPIRRFDEHEVARILERATELHREEPTTPAGAGGLTLEELEEIARETGIDPRHLRRAAMELDTQAARSGGLAKRFLGEDPTLRFRTTVPGELRADDFERVVAVVHRNTPEHGHPSLLGRSLTWRAETSGKSRTIQVTVSSQDGVTEIAVEERLHQLAGGLFGGGLGGFGGGIGVGVGLPLAIEVVGSAAAAVAFPLGVLGLTYMGVREIFRQVVKRRRRALAALMDALVQEVRRSVGARADGVAEAGEERRLPG